MTHVKKTVFAWHELNLKLWLKWPPFNTFAYSFVTKRLNFKNFCRAKAIHTDKNTYSALGVIHVAERQETSVILSLSFKPLWSKWRCHFELSLKHLFPRQPRISFLRWAMKEWSKAPVTCTHQRIFFLPKENRFHLTLPASFQFEHLWFSSMNPLTISIRGDILFFLPAATRYVLLVM